MSNFNRKMAEKRLNDWHTSAQKAATAKNTASVLAQEKFILLDNLVLKHMTEHNSTIAEANRFAKTSKSYDICMRKHLKAEAIADTLSLTALKLERLYQIEMRDGTAND